MKFLLILIFSVALYSKEIFSIKPYIFISSNNMSYLTFELKEKSRVRIKLPNKLKQHFINSKLFFQEKKFYKLKLGELKCSKKYDYEILIRDSKQGFVDSLPVPCSEEKEVKFIFLSDTQSIKTRRWLGYKRHKSVALALREKLMSQRHSFLVHAGDVVSNGGVVNDWEKFFDVSFNYLDFLPIISAIGNHDYYKERFEGIPESFFKYFRSSQDHKNATLFLNFPQFNLLVHNTNYDFLSKKEIREQIKWMKAKLKKSEKQVVVVSHHPAFSSTLGHLTKDSKFIREKLAPIWEESGKVRLVLAGHVHMYERSEKDGITYINAGSAGGVFNPVRYKNPYSLFYKFFTPTYSSVQISGKSVRVETFDKNNERVDFFEHLF